MRPHFCLFRWLSVPEYDVTTPFRTDESGGYLSHDLELHRARQVQSAQRPNVWYFKMKAFGKSLHLNLTKSTDFLSSGLKAERYQNGSVSYEDLPENYFLKGHVSSAPGSSVSISNYNGLVGRHAIPRWRQVDKNFIAFKINRLF